MHDAAELVRLAHGLPSVPRFGAGTDYHGIDGAATCAYMRAALDGVQRVHDLMASRPPMCPLHT